MEQYTMLSMYFSPALGCSNYGNTDETGKLLLI
jgi:hypothetical protein